MSDREICAYCKCVKGRYDPCGCRGETAARDVRDLSFRLSRTELERDEARYKAEQNRLKANLADQMRSEPVTLDGWTPSHHRSRSTTKRIP